MIQLQEKFSQIIAPMSCMYLAVGKKCEWYLVWIIMPKSKLLMCIKLKADRLHLRNCPHMPTDYRHTDKHQTLVMTPIKQESANGQSNGGTDATKRIISLLH